MASDDVELSRLDDAARAGWLYYVGGRTQEEIAKTMGISRQKAQRLVSRAAADGLIRVRIEHPIAELMELAQALRKKYQLELVRVAPDIGVEGNLASVASFAGRMIEEVLWSADPKTIGLGTGRFVRAAVERVTPMDGSHHRLVSFISIIAPDGTANIYDAIMHLADLTHAPHYPLPTPVLAETEAEQKLYTGLNLYRKVADVADAAEYVFVGIGQMDENAPIIIDGFMSKEEWQESRAMGAVGEIASRAYDKDGRYIDSQFSRRVTSLPVAAAEGKIVVGIAAGQSKLPSLKAALKGQLINALVTDEPTARALL